MYFFNPQKRRKELEETSLNDNLLLAKSSLEINLLPESQEDRNLASLLSLCPSRSIEEKQNHTRSKILNSPALPSSSGLLTSFGGLKKEDSLSKTPPLSRNALGIMIKKTKIETASENVDEINKNTKHSGLNFDDSKSIDIKVDTECVKKDQVIEQKVYKGDLCETKCDTTNKVLSLVCDYSSSGESSD